MSPDDKKRLSAVVLLVLPIYFWLEAVRRTETIGAPKLKAIWELIISTPQKPLLLTAAIIGFLVAGGLVWLIQKIDDGPFSGAYFRRWLRGTRLVTPSKLKRLVREPGDGQVEVAGIPWPTRLENLHLLLNGATGKGKSVLLRSLAWSGLKRSITTGERFIFVDPNGDMLSKFYRPGDVILNPYDIRSEGWSFFNEIRNTYDFERYALSIVPRGQTKEAEEWAGYARLLLRETAKKLHELNTPSVMELFRLTTIVPPEELKEFLAGTYAESLFVGADKALASARFVLSDKLPEHVKMRAGHFSLRDWLTSGDRSNLYITWREDMAEALKPLISAWVDVLCTSILSLPEDSNRKLWMFIDEMASLEKLASLEAALTKGRKHGLRVVAALQSTAQLDDVYGEKEAQVLRSCFSNLVVFGGTKTDPKTCEDMSRSLGEHEVERDKRSTSSGDRSSTSKSDDRTKERVVLPSEIAALPELCCYVAFAGDYPVSRVTLVPLQFKTTSVGVEETLRYVKPSGIVA